MIPIQCTECGGLSQIDDAWLGRHVECPHCHRPTAAMTPGQGGPPPAPPPPPPTSAPLSVGGEALELKHRAESAVTTTALAAQPISNAPSATPAAELPPKRPPLSRAEREAIRQRRHLILALSGAVILLIAAYILFTLSGGSGAID